MKHLGSSSEFLSQRDSELLSNFSYQLINASPEEDPFRLAAEMPASRFWVSERRAAVVMRKMLKGKSIEDMYPKKREMYIELFKRVKRIIGDNPGMDVYSASFIAVNSEAPEFYLSPESARVTIYKLRAQNRRTR